MKAIICKKFGPPSTLKLLEIQDIFPGDKEVKIAIEACGVNFPDTLIIENKYQFHRSSFMHNLLKRYEISKRFSSISVELKLQ